MNSKTQMRPCVTFYVGLLYQLWHCKDLAYQIASCQKEMFSDGIIDRNPDFYGINR